MTVQCVTCDRLDLRQAGRMAAHGFGCCRLRPTHEFHSVLQDRECPQHVPAQDAQVASRRAWLARKGEEPCST